MIRILHLVLPCCVQFYFVNNCAAMRQDYNHVVIMYNGEPNRNAVVYLT